EVEIDPVGGAAALGAAEQLAIEGPGAGEVVDGKGEVEERTGGGLQRFLRAKRHCRKSHGDPAPPHPGTFCAGMRSMQAKGGQMDRTGERPRHFSMIREFRVADFFTLGNAACGVAGILLAMLYVAEPDITSF